VLTILENLIDTSMVTRLRTWLNDAVFEDGRVTAGGNAALVKRNEQVSDDPKTRDPQLGKMQDLVLEALHNNGPFRAAAQPKTILDPIFSRYTPGMAYGTHMDNAMMDDMRVDLSLTLFLSDPSEYEGGELVIDFSTGTQSIKLSAGSAVLYPTTALHHVAEVTRGQRLAGVTWVRSLIRDPAKREILFDLKVAQIQLNKLLGKRHEIDLLSKTYTNLVRRWAED
jgi:PKHD-type hydroxylase